MAASATVAAGWQRGEPRGFPATVILSSEVARQERIGYHQR